MYIYTTPGLRAIPLPPSPIHPSIYPSILLSSKYR